MSGNCKSEQFWWGLMKKDKISILKFNQCSHEIAHRIKKPEVSQSSDARLLRKQNKNRSTIKKVILILFMGID